MTLTEYILTIKGLHTGLGAQKDIKCLIHGIYVYPMKHYSCDESECLCESIYMEIEAAEIIFGDWKVAGISVNNDGCFAAPVFYVYKEKSKQERAWEVEN